MGQAVDMVGKGGTLSSPSPRFKASSDTNELGVTVLSPSFLVSKLWILIFSSQTSERQRLFREYP